MTDRVRVEGGRRKEKRTARAKVLIVDDELRNRQVLAEQVAGFGHEVAVAGDWPQVLGLVQETSFDLVLLDIDMRTEDGWQVLESVKTDEALRHLPVIVLSADENSETVARCIALGADDQFSRGSDPLVLEARITASLQRKGLRDWERAAIEKLEEEKKRSDDLLNVVIPLGVALSGEKNLDRLLERILTEAKRLCNADAGTLYLREGAALSFAIMATDSLGIAMGRTTGKEIGFPPVPLADASGAPNEKNVSAYAALHGSTVNIPDIYSSEGFDFSGTKTFDERNRYRSISSLTVPLKNHVNEVIGVLQLINAQGAIGRVIPFSPYQQQVVESMASLAAVALNNHILLERQRQLLIYERDLQIGRGIQGDFLPRELPEAPGWQIAARFQPARQVAGDFYDAFVLPGGLIGLVIADVCDKGVGAALFMAIFRSLIRAFAQQHGAEACGHERHGARVAGAPGTTILKHAVELTNSYIAENHSSTNMFATLFFGVLDPTTGRLVYGNGGHEAPIVFPPGGEVKSRLQPTGPAVGMFPDVEFGVVEVVLDRGETLLAFTDGIPDARNEQRAFFTEERLLALLKEPAPSVVALLDRIEERLKAHTGHADPFDDVTLLAVRRE